MSISRYCDLIPCELIGRGVESRVLAVGRRNGGRGGQTSVPYEHNKDKRNSWNI